MTAQINLLSNEVVCVNKSSQQAPYRGRTMNSKEGDADTPLTNTLFPPPPRYYKAYADYNGESSGTNKGKLVEEVDDLGIGAKRRSEEGDIDEKGTTSAVESGETAGQDHEGHRLSQESTVALTESERVSTRKPRVDWVEEDGRWMSFGQMYTVSR